jgi:hypothetical protein
LAVKPADPKYVAAWYGNLLAVRGPWESMWQDLANYLTPNKAMIITKKSPGSKTTEFVFDGTGERSLRRAGANMHGSLTSASLKWFALKMRDNNLNNSKPVRIWLEDCVTRMLNTFNQSNFGSEAQELYIDLAGFGTGSLFTEEIEQ